MHFMKLDIHKIDNRLEKTLENLNALKPEERKLILEFYEKYCIKNDLSKARSVKLVFLLRLIVQKTGKNVCDLTEEDIDNLIIKLNKADYSPETVRDYKVMLKTFFKWYDKGEKIGIVANLKAVIPKNKRKVIKPEDLLNDDEKLRLLQACNTSMQKAFISCLMETGARVAEIGNARIGDVHFDESGADITISGKTGTRRVRLVLFRNNLMKWINEHPLVNDSKAPLWVTKQGEIKQMQYTNIRKMINTIGKRASITKRINPHSFRHLRATELLTKLPQGIASSYLGWELDSKMPKIYGHISNEQVSDAYNGLYGIVKKTKTQLNQRVCPRCLIAHSPTETFCSKCNMPLEKSVNEQKIFKDMVKENQKEQFFTMLDEWWAKKQQKEFELARQY
ncbi:MAG: tyrosine-type recombinase/integrase [Candidatus Iainarchaeum sp.]|jgi:integrase/recombinase XerD